MNIHNLGGGRNMGGWLLYWKSSSAFMVSTAAEAMRLVMSARKLSITSLTGRVSCFIQKSQREPLFIRHSLSNQVSFLTERQELS